MFYPRMLRITRRSRNFPLLPGALLLFASGCQWFVNDADNEVYSLIEKRQLQALGETQSAEIDREDVPITVDCEGYEFIPHPLEPGVPTDFLQPAASATQPAPLVSEIATSRPITNNEQPVEPSRSSVESVATRPAPDFATATRPSDAGMLGITQPSATTQPARVLTLSDALAYAFANSRAFQTAKEELYLTALALTLERHLWSPRAFGNIGAEYANYGAIRNFDHAMAAVAQVGVQQRLPLGGEVTARIVDNLMRDLTHHVTTAETGAAILEANIPLLRGAGLVAYESRFQAERDLIYAVRNFETFRRALAVDIAGDYFNLQQLRQGILNARESIRSLNQVATRARARWVVGWEKQLDVQRAEQDKLTAIVQEVNAIESYRAALDAFKLQLGMPMEIQIDVSPAEIDAVPQNNDRLTDVNSLEEALQMPAVSEEEAIRVALKYRLELINRLDRIDDGARGVKVAENNLLPDLDASGSLTYNTDPARLGTWKFEDDRATWRAAMNLELPLDRKAERNALRSSLILKRRAERDYEEFKDTVILQVRRAMRRVQQQQQVLQVQMVNRDLAIERRRAAQYRFDLGQIDNRDIIDAERELLRARDDLAEAQAQLRLAILQFRRDTGTLRVDDQGRWSSQVATEPPSE